MVFDRCGGVNVIIIIIFCDIILKVFVVVGFIINGYGKIVIVVDSDDDGIKENYVGNKLVCF